MQDSRYLLDFPNRGSALDILDNNATRSCTITQPPMGKTPQLDTCLNEFLVDQVAPDVHCLASGVCNDPLKIPSTGVPVPQSLVTLGGRADNRDPGGGIAIRLVFDKVLDNSIEMITTDPMKAPGSNNTYTILPGIIEFDGPDGMPFGHTTADPMGLKSVLMYYDNGGSPNFSADLELVPLGPAIVIKPRATLDNTTTYTIKFVKPDAIKDREGKAATGFGGGALTSLKFTTEDLTAANAGTFGDSAFDYTGVADPTKKNTTDSFINPNEVIQIGFFEAVVADNASGATVTVKSGCTGAKPIIFSDRGSDATMCTMAEPGGLVADIVNTANGMTGPAIDWPAGACTISISVPAANGKGAPWTSDYSFVVGVPCAKAADCASAGGDAMSMCTAGVCSDPGDPMTDANIFSNHLTPAECTM